MKEYTEKDPKRIEDLLAVRKGAESVKANELKQYKESGLRVIEYGTEDVQRIIKGEKTYCIGLVPSDENGGKTWHCFTPEAQEIWDNDKKAQEFRYWETINKKVYWAKRMFLSDLKESPNPAETVADRIRRIKWRLNPDSDPNAVRELGLDPNNHLKFSWRRLIRGLREYKTDVYHHEQVLADTENEFLKWLIELQKNPKPEMMKHLKTRQQFNEASENLNISDVRSSKNHLTKDEIISTGDWYEADYINLMEGYFWKHKNIEEDGYVFYMKRYKNDGFTTIIEQGKDDNKLFEGYIKNIEELKQIVHLCRLHEI